MGIYDRDYFQEDNRGWLEGGARSMVVNLIIVNVVVYIAEVLFKQYDLARVLALQADTWQRPWECWKLLTAGFAHSDSNVFHILFNMYALWLFGRDLEGTLGKKEFLSFYLSTIVLANLGWLLARNLYAPGAPASIVGASGGVMGVAVLYAFRRPHSTIYVWFIPIPAWLFVGFLVFNDWQAFQSGSGGDVAYEAHLVGALCGFLYFKFQWQLGALLPAGFSGRAKRMMRGGPNLKIHREQTTATPIRENLEGQVDELLEKIQRYGEGSLTPAERATLEEASRRYRRRTGK